MEAKKYDRIADLLLQIRKNYVLLQGNSMKNEKKIQMMLFHLNQAIVLNDELGELDGKGWL